MKTIKEYLEKLSSEILVLGGDKRILEEYESNLWEEFEEFTSSIPIISEDQNPEELFLSNLEAPYTIAKSLIGSTESSKARLSIPVHNVWKWYNEKILSKFLGFPLTIMSLCLIPTLIMVFLVLNDWFLALLMDLFPGGSIIIDMWTSSFTIPSDVVEIVVGPEMLHYLYMLVVVFLSYLYSLNKKIVLTIILSALAVPTQLFLLPTIELFRYHPFGYYPTSGLPFTFSPDFLFSYLGAILFYICISLLISYLINITPGSKNYKKTHV